MSIEDKSGGYVSRIEFNDGGILNCNEDDIVVFVGPNNAGKSQSLKDIYEIANGQGVEGVVIKDVEIRKYPTSVLPIAKKVAKIRSAGYQMNEIQFMHSSFGYDGSLDDVYRNASKHGWLRDMFMAKVDTLTRLQLCEPAPAIPYDDIKTHPIHYAASDSACRKQISQYFKQAFNYELIPNTHFGGQIPLVISKEIPKLNNEFSDEQERVEAYARQLSLLSRIHEQGDGMKSFASVLLYLAMDNYCSFLIDEPESFLHPPQALIMGRTLGGDLSEGQQVFISTHSEEIIKGLLESNPSRVKIVRITRNEGYNRFSILDNNDLLALWRDPILKYSNILSSLFYKTVVLCESDSDCKMYAIIERRLKEENGQNSETLFIHCGGKYRFSRIVKALRLLDVDIRVIADIDVMNDKNTFRSIIEVFGGDWGRYEADYDSLNEYLKSVTGAPKKRRDIKSAIDTDICWNLDSGLTKDEKEIIRGALKNTSPWAKVKKEGVSSFPNDIRIIAENLLVGVAELGFNIVPVGELESFIDGTGGHGPEWVNKVLERYPDTSDPVYFSIRSFVGGLGL